MVFALGCSFSFEEPLVDAGLRLRHWEDGSVCPMFLTDIDCAPAGRFHSKLVVSMRPFTPADAVKAVQITSRYPRVHGAPVHLGMPELIGVEDIGPRLAGRRPEARPGPDAGFLGLRSDAAGGRALGAPAAGDHAHAGPHARHRCEKRLARRGLTAAESAHAP